MTRSYLDKSLNHADFKLLNQFLSQRIMTGFTLRARGEPLIIRIILSLGLRTDELLKIKFTDFDLELNSVFITGSKGSESCSMKINKALMESLLTLKQEYEILYGLPLDEVWRLVVGPKNYKPQSVARELRDVWAKLRFACFGDKNRHVTVHGLRHSYAYRLLDGGLSLAHVQQALRHKAIGSTIYYLAARARAEISDKALKVIDM